jgi:GTPase
VASVQTLIDALLQGEAKALSRAISLVENRDPRAQEILKAAYPRGRDIPLIGVTGPAGVGKSSLVDRLISLYRAEGKKVGIIAVDPSSPFTGGAILGDRIRMQQHGTDPDVFIRSMATRGKLGGIAAATFDVMDLMNASGKDVIIVETVGVGQDEVDIVKIVNTTVVVLMPGLGDEVQAMKAGLMEIADLLVINKADRDDADKMEMELQGAVSFFQPGSAQEWRPKILKTQANNNLGIDSLLAAIREHDAYIRSTGRLEGKILSQSRQRLVDALQDQVTHYVLEEGSDRFHISERIEDIATRRTDPFTIVLELLSRLKIGS